MCTREEFNEFPLCRDFVYQADNYVENLYRAELPPTYVIFQKIWEKASERVIKYKVWSRVVP